MLPDDSLLFALVTLIDEIPQAPPGGPGGAALLFPGRLDLNVVLKPFLQAA